ncbi:hypothetical protein CBL_05504 [Carabus blaptoides fortunei]
MCIVPWSQPTTDRVRLASLATERLRPGHGLIAGSWDRLLLRPRQYNYSPHPVTPLVQTINWSKELQQHCGRQHRYKGKSLQQYELSTPHQHPYRQAFGERRLITAARTTTAATLEALAVIYYCRQQPNPQAQGRITSYSLRKNIRKAGPGRQVVARGVCVCYHWMSWSSVASLPAMLVVCGLSFCIYRGESIMGAVYKKCSTVAGTEGGGVTGVRNGVRMQERMEVIQPKRLSHFSSKVRNNSATRAVTSNSGGTNTSSTI